MNICSYNALRRLSREKLAMRSFVQFEAIPFVLVLTISSEGLIRRSCPSEYTDRIVEHGLPRLRYVLMNY